MAARSITTTIPALLLLLALLFVLPSTAKEIDADASAASVNKELWRQAQVDRCIACTFLVQVAHTGLRAEYDRRAKAKTVGETQEELFQVGKMVSTACKKKSPVRKAYGAQATAACALLDQSLMDTIAKRITAAPTDGVLYPWTLGAAACVVRRRVWCCGVCGAGGCSSSDGSSGASSRRTIGGECVCGTAYVAVGTEAVASSSRRTIGGECVCGTACVAVASEVVVSSSAIRGEQPVLRGVLPCVL